MRWQWIASLAAVALVCLGSVGCSTMLPAVRLDPSLGPPAPPPILDAFGDDAPVANNQDWETRRAPLLRARFAEEVYGPYPNVRAAPRVVSRTAIAYAPLADIADISQWQIEVQGAGDPLRFNMVVVLPKGATGPVPIIIMENFCGDRAAFRHPPETIAGPLTEVLWACEAEWTAPLVEGIFGRHISVPPYEQILSRGYGLAMFYAGDVVADEPVAAREGLRQLYGDRDDVGAIAVWAWLYSVAFDMLQTDARVDQHRVAIWGHSRNGKAALLAGAMDPRFTAIIAHQSGRGGASLSSSLEGEPIAKMHEAFPHWFPPVFANAPSSPAMDQHQLLALIAPRPVLLGNGARDAWSDPHGAWQAARAASPVYRLYGKPGLDQPEMTTPNYAAGIAYYTRPGLHGVTTRDWNVFLDFLDANLGAR
ncbi:hypothetical protein [Terricaulis sp.]|uniref:alpha/beta hydrolase family protein n=1 Tax=Terricaulis sp. TaxID=2768686 RepID=UPI003784BF09